MKSGSPPIPILLVLGGAFVATSLFALVSGGSSHAIGILGLGIVIFFGITLYNSRIDAGKQTAVISLSIAGVLGLIIVLSLFNILQTTVPICGDGVCAKGECHTQCTEDCSAELCEDGVCQRPMETCKNSVDCACPGGTECLPERPGVDDSGCFVVSCGDRFCDRQEDSDTCCTDCGCEPGHDCKNNQCFFVPPKLAFSSYIYVREIGVSTLAANPNLRNASGTPHPLVALDLENQGALANDVRVTFALGHVFEETFTVGSLAPGQERDVLWFLDKNPMYLSVTERENTNITVQIEYETTEGVRNSFQLAYPITLLPRQEMGRMGKIEYYITPNDIPTNSRSYEGIWDELRQDLTYVADKPGIQYPRETLAYGEGDRQDLALLFTSAFENAKLKPLLANTTKGLMIWVKAGGDYAVLDPARLGFGFTQALETKPGRTTLISFNETWEKYHIKPATFDKRLLPGVSISSSTQLEQECNCVTYCGPKITATHTITNKGLVTSPVCAISSITDSSKIYDEKTQCFSLKRGESRGMSHNWKDREECVDYEVDLRVVNSTG